MEEVSFPQSFYQWFSNHIPVSKDMYISYIRNYICPVNNKCKCDRPLVIGQKIEVLIFHILLSVQIAIIHDWYMYFASEIDF